MILLLPGVSRNWDHLIVGSKSYGLLYTPRNPSNRFNGQHVTWAADNRCYVLGEKFDFDQYLSFCWQVKPYSGRCLFVAAPDVVGDAEKTLARWHKHYQPLHQVGLPLAYVAQDGLERLPRVDFQALFIGGTTAYKLGPTARRLIADARRAGLWVHVGRVNSIARMRYFWHLGADSVDGTDVCFGPKKNLPKWVRELGWQERQIKLTGD